MDAKGQRYAPVLRSVPGLRTVRLHEWRPPGHRRLKLQGGRTYVCRHCRAPMRVASSHYLPGACAWCGASTWDDEGRCQSPAGCDATCPPDSRTPGFCPVCGWSVWAPLALGRGPGAEAA